MCGLGHTYANCVDHTSACIFYVAAAVEDLTIYGFDVSNAFGKAPAPKQGTNLQPDKAFYNLWRKQKGGTHPTSIRYPGPS